MHTASPEGGSGVWGVQILITPDGPEFPGLCAAPTPCPHPMTYGGSGGSCSTCLAIFAGKTLERRERGNGMTHVLQFCRPQR